MKINSIKKQKNKFYLVPLLLVLLVGSTVTLALMMGKSNLLTNTFHAADHQTGIEENVDGLKKEVRVQNKSESSPAFIRVRLVVSPEDSVDLIFGGENGDVPDDWEYNEEDGFYYYLKGVPANEYTSYLLKSVELKNGFNGDTFDVTVYEESCIATVGANTEMDLDTIIKAFEDSTKHIEEN